ncbi:hypothetical protein AVEN_55770-1 [Araneus ventricosus]|uniref:Uncharacterized protein n=1 Tax=Araneus ventricosus TaxID=182803 RepID=A0A4Y2EW28_ARAVE|nr:hypothetical protein AVEN_55770-1 [Araneus ventricosus]
MIGFKMELRWLVGQESCRFRFHQNSAAYTLASRTVHAQLIGGDTNYVGFRRRQRDSQFTLERCLSVGRLFERTCTTESANQGVFQSDD